MADHGIVVGIDTYPGLGKLDGPCNDAKAFYDWLVHPVRGGVDPANVQLLLSSDFDEPEANDPQTAHPHESEVLALFFPFVDKVLNDEHEAGRLFVYMAGHGFSDTQDQESAALYTANAGTNRPLHLAVSRCTDWLRRNWAFDEVILIMDTCRTTNPMHEITNPQLPRTNGNTNARKVKRFHGFAAGWRQESREKDFDGEVRGIFSVAFMDALQNATPNRLGRVTGTIVEDYIHNVIEDFAGDIEIGAPEIYAKKHMNVCFVTRSENTLDVDFQVNGVHLGHELVVFTHDLREVERRIIDDEEFGMPLEAGKFYYCSVVGKEELTPFQVPTDAPIQIQ